MTDAQWKVRSNQITADVGYEFREFRKKCVTQGIVEFVREDGYYAMKYRGVFVCRICNDGNERLKMCAVWNTIKIAETIGKIEGVKYDC